MIVHIEVLKSGGTCQISNNELTDFLKYDFEFKKLNQSTTIEFRNKNQEEFRREGVIKIRFSNSRYSSKDHSPEITNYNKIHTEVLKFLLRRWKQ